MNPLRRSFLKERRILGRRHLLGLMKKLCSFHKNRRIMHKIILEEDVAEEKEDIIILETGGKKFPRRKI